MLDMKKLYIVSLLAFMFSAAGAQNLFTEQTIKLARTIALVDAFYVDSTDTEMLTEKAIKEVLKNLDPHSQYFSADEVKEMNEGLEGNFEGIGIQFNILYDSIIVIAPIPGGPSEKVGLRAGDRIVTIENESVAGTGISTTGVRKRLLGEKGTPVKVGIYRRGVKGILDFTILRDKIPVNSLDAAYMIGNDVGYVKLNKFSATSEKEFSDAVDRLLDENMDKLVIDLRNNTGGYLEAAIRMCDNLFSDRKLIVYLEGLKTPRQDFRTRGGGKLDDTRIVVLVDEGSASASEILSGAMQDWDRGVVVGRRTFGKGLVQNGFSMQDGSMIRLTIARYFTPTGRLIQRPYSDGLEKYVMDYYERYSNGELMSADSISFPDSLRYKTLVNGRTVYGGGGIMPDLFVPMDTSWYSDYYRQLISKNVITEFILDYVDQNRKALNRKYNTFEKFYDNFSFEENEIQDFIQHAEKLGVKYVEDQYNKSQTQLLRILKGLIARDIWDMSEYYEVVNTDDMALNMAVELLRDERRYFKILGSN